MNSHLQTGSCTYPPVHRNVESLAHNSATSHSKRLKKQKLMQVIRRRRSVTVTKRYDIRRRSEVAMGKEGWDEGTSFLRLAAGESGKCMSIKRHVTFRDHPVVECDPLIWYSLRPPLQSLNSCDCLLFHNLVEWHCSTTGIRDN